jgi:hypothetical protein
MTVKLCMTIGKKLHVCGVFVMLVLTAADGFCCVRFIVL